MKNYHPADRVGFRTVAISRLALVMGCSVLTTFAANDWPAWRGPRGDGTSATAKNLPVTWASDKNIKWKFEMPAWSGSSPVVWGDKVFVNSPSREEAQAENAPAASAGPRARRPGRSPATKGPGGQELL